MRKKNPGGGRGTTNGEGTPYRHYSRRANAVSTVPIYVGETVVGYVAGDTFQKTVQASKHFLRRPRAIAFDVSTLHDAEGAGARRVAVTDTESGRVYQLPLSTVWAEGFEFDRGWGHQIAVPLSEWLRPGERVAEQPSLFGGAS